MGCDAKMKNRAFTLVEILVVIAIIAVLAAITIPALSMAKQRSQDAVCLANLRQLGVALYGYASDNNDRLPCQSSTPINPVIPHPLLGTLGPYGLKSETLRCPRDYFVDFDRGTTDYTLNHFARCGSSYEVNLVLGSYTLSGVPDPSGSALANDFFSFHSRPSDTPQWFQVLFFDGHVKKTDWARRAELLFSPGQRPSFRPN